jgi:type II secretory ATPase GspE/PulE/Tfp pilus assembly ATPase PilB-like protein
MARFKIMASLELAEKTRSQTGLFKIKILGLRRTTFEVSTSVSEGIETLTLRKI